MIYRKTPLQPARLLLRVVAGVGAFAAVTSVAACSSSSSQGVQGITGNPEGDGGDASAEDSSLQNDGPNGIVAYPDAGADTMNIFCCLDGSVSGVVDAAETGPVGLFGNDSGAGDASQDQ